jgi:flagellar basal body-associated protein FliL
MAEEAVKNPAPAKAKASSGVISSIVGPLAAVVVLLGIGAGLALFVTNVILPKKTPPKTEQPGRETILGDPLLTETEQISFMDLLTNVQGEKGRRYVKVTCIVCVSKNDMEKIVPYYGGEGAVVDGPIKRSLRMALEEHLKTYDLEALTAPNIYMRLKSGFKTALENQLKTIFPETQPDYRYVKDIILNNLLVQ